ncbi:MAG: hypothetical protein RJB56_890 [Actinomycetota bacterium]|jgi:DNA-binding PadR family transcriptional regulator
MSESSKNSELRELLGDLVSVVRERAGKAFSSSSSSSSSKMPAEAQLKTAILASISIEAKNAQEMISAIVVSSGGALRPTSGQVQTTLSSLSEEKLVSSKTDGDRKVYTITKAGKAVLKEAAANPVTESASARPSMPNMNLLNCDAAFLKSATKLGPVMLDVAQTGTREQQQAAAAALDEMRHQLHVILAGK